MMLEKGGQSEWAENRKGQCDQSASQAKGGNVFLLISTAHGCPTSYGEESLPGRCCKEWLKVSQDGYNGTGKGHQVPPW